MENIEKRLLALEKSNKRYRVLFGAALAGIAFFTINSFTSRPPVPEVVQAKKFELVNESGKVLVRIENYEGSGAITTMNSRGGLLTDIVPTKGNSGGIVMYDRSGNKNIVLTDVTGGGGSLVIYNTDEKGVISMGRNTKDAGSMTMSNASSNKVIQITADQGNAGVVLTYDQYGTQSARLPN